MNSIDSLLNALANCKDTSNDALKIIASDLFDHKNVLDNNNIVYEEQAEGIYIDLSIQAIKIYKNKTDCLNFFDGNTLSTILILKEKLSHENTAVTYDLFFENLFYSEQLKILLLENNVVSYHDKLSKKLIFLSEKKGKIEVGYGKKNVDFFDHNYNLKSIYEKLNNKLQENEYISFFRDNFIDKVDDHSVMEERYYFALTLINNIFEKANREFELYKNKFSFEDFQSKLDEEKDKYFKNIQDNLSEFLSKANSLPIQFGVYIYLIFRFQTEVIPLIVTILILIVWSCFSWISINTMKKGIDYLSNKFDAVFQKISLKSGIDTIILESEQSGVNSRIQSILSLIKWYKIIIVLFTFCLILLCLYFIDHQAGYKIFNNINMYINDLERIFG